MPSRTLCWCLVMFGVELWWGWGRHWHQARHEDRHWTHRQPLLGRLYLGNDIPKHALGLLQLAQKCIFDPTVPTGGVVKWHSPSYSTHGWMMVSAWHVHAR